MRQRTERRRIKQPAAPALPPWVRLVRVAEEREQWAAHAAHVGDDGDVAELVRARLAAEEVEVMVAVSVDGRNRVIAINEVARGGAHGLAVTAREIFRAAIALGASGIVLAHNHPSGSPAPSREDDQMTRVVHEAGALIGVPLLDHVIVAGTTGRFSYLAAGRLDP